MAKMAILRIVLTLLQLRNVLCKDAWEIPNTDMKGIEERVKKTTIVAYDKSKMTTDEIEAEKLRIEKECNCDVENLASVGAFILTYPDPGMSRSVHLDPSKEIGVEDQIVSIFDEKIPADPNFKQQWSLQDLANKADINAKEGWNAYMNDSKGADPNGPSVIVAVIDTGVDYTHPDLKDVMWTNTKEIADNGKDDDGNGVIDDVYGADFTLGNGNPMDNNGHGTHCAGVIAAKENNDVGIVGVASYTQGKVKIMGLKGLADNGRTATSMLFRSLNYAISNGAAISSNSWGGGYLSDGMIQMWGTVLKNNPNHLFVAAAGNDWIHIESEIGNSWRRNTCGLKEPNFLCVGSSTKDNEKSYFSNYGKDFVHVMAPGTDIYSTMPRGGYYTMSGTSMACPHVSGLAALVKTMKPEFTGQQIREAIENNVQKKDVYKNFVSTGGLIDMGKTVNALVTPRVIEKCLTSPGYPNKYPDDSNKEYEISVADGMSIKVTFKAFDVEHGSDTCPYDYVQFSDANGGVVGSKLCGKTLPKDITIGTSTASVLFKTDGSVNEKGFKFCYVGVARP